MVGSLRLAHPTKLGSMVERIRTEAKAALATVA
jgi:hypothetical protein